MHQSSYRIVLITTVGGLAVALFIGAQLRVPLLGWMTIG